MKTQPPQPLVSVIMPVYNAEKFLRESLDSVLRQTFTNFELIILNDGSTDGSQDIIDEYKKRDSRIVTIKQENHGVVYTANKGISLAKGKYIARMDADDVSLPDRLLQQTQILDAHKKTVLVCSSFEIFNDDGEFCYRDIALPRNAEIKRALYLRNPIANGSTLIRKDILQEVGCFDDVFAEDFHLWMKLAEKGDFEATGTTLYRWRMNPDGLTLTNNKLSIDRGKEYITDRWKAFPPENVSRNDILSTSSHYLEVYGKKGIRFKHVFLTDLSQFAVKLFLKGHYIRGVKQLFAVALTGRTGLRIALRRIHLISKGHYNKLRRKIPFGRGAYETTY